jgi:hypothetical protein
LDSKSKKKDDIDKKNAIKTAIEKIQEKFDKKIKALFKNTDGSNTSFNGNTAVDMTGGVYYAKESSHTLNADEATHATSATAVNAFAPTGQTKDLVKR